ncbi:hypothetical protein [Paenibacillus aquistagni]|uniref:Uncharacterized protein n=1 Tax=Paenibacillus aquistagni TaxID=1852522 RepID=A0A1X7LXW6_9BACL|nr:hypothetical protein [Paenibacillus aquistagni]SMG58277.1 hypothetical protein SAMN06295960_4660 [Paenibacillus aquistagni]
MIEIGDILIMKNGRAYEVIMGQSDNLVEGDLVVVEVDEDNRRISENQQLKIVASTPIIDIIR